MSWKSISVWKGDHHLGQLRGIERLASNLHDSLGLELKGLEDVNGFI